MSRKKYKVILYQVLISFVHYVSVITKYQNIGNSKGCFINIIFYIA